MFLGNSALVLLELHQSSRGLLSRARESSEVRQVRHLKTVNVSRTFQSNPPNNPSGAAAQVLLQLCDATSVDEPEK